MQIIVKIKQKKKLKESNGLVGTSRALLRVISLVGLGVSKGCGNCHRPYYIIKNAAYTITEAN
jgi:hypothetical protein